MDSGYVLTAAKSGLVKTQGILAIDQVILALKKLMWFNVNYYIQITCRPASPR